MPEMTIQQALELARRQFQSGNLQPAEALCRQVLAAAPNQPNALYLLGTIAFQVGRPDVAVDLIRRALSVKHDFPEAWNDLGISLRSCGQIDQATAAFRQAIAIQPNNPQAYNNLGSILQESDQPEQGAAAIQKALELRPDFAEAHNNLGNALQSLRRYKESIDCYRKAIALKPDFFDAHSNLGNALRTLDRLDEAVASYRRSIAIQPAYAEAHTNLGIALLEQGDLDQAIAEQARAVELQPNWPLAHYNLGLSLLHKGDYPRGWIENEWRAKAREIGYLCQDFPQPKWKGESLQGRTILLHTEQGFGDAIQFIRYLPQVFAAGGKVLLECQTELLRLFSRLEGIEELIERERPLPHFDVHSPLLSLPPIFGTTATTIPAPIPYLTADPELSAIWKARLADERFKIGLIWSGRSTPNLRRSIPPELLSPLAALEGIAFVSLQNADAVDPRKPPLPLLDWTGDLRDFADTAALMDNLDLVISIDTAAAHLAGAMGKEVWVLLPAAADWRWTLDRDRSPWYPSMKLFRQPKVGDWTLPINEVVETLRRMEK